MRARRGSKGPEPSVRSDELTLAVWCVAPSGPCHPARATGRGRRRRVRATYMSALSRGEDAPNEWCITWLY